MKLTLLPVAAASLALVAGCHSSSPNAAPPAPVPGTASGSLGDLTLSGGYIPQQASPDVAAGYLQITNRGGEQDTLLGASTPAAKMVMLHDTVENGGSSTMTPLKELAVPAHQSVGFSVGKKHLMIMGPAHMLKAGETVPLTLRFAKAGTVTLTVPVTALTGPAEAPMPSMSGMNTGMHMGH